MSFKNADLNFKSLTK